MIRVLILDDDALVGHGLEALLRDAGADVVATVHGVEDAIAWALSATPDVILADVMIDGNVRGLDLPDRLREAGSAVPVVFLSSYPRPYFVERARASGARGFLDKSTPIGRVIAALEGAVAGIETYPARERQTPRVPSGRQLEVLEGLVAGLSHKEISGALGLSTRTVDGHVRRMHERYGVDSRGALVMLALQTGWVTLPEGRFADRRRGARDSEAGSYSPRPWPGSTRRGRARHPAGYGAVHRRHGRDLKGLDRRMSSNGTGRWVPASAQRGTGIRRIRPIRLSAFACSTH